MSKADEIKGWASHYSQMSVRAAQDMAGSEEYDAQEEAKEALDAAIDAQQAEILSLRAAVADLLSGWRYIRQSHGDLYGVGWDRAEKRAIIALGALPEVDPHELGTIITNALSQVS